MERYYIIPTIGRELIGKTIGSICANDEDCTILVSKGGTASENRNKILNKILKIEDDDAWLIFVDDDDYYENGYLTELDPEFDIIVLRMRQGGTIIPQIHDNTLRLGNIGINFVVKLSFFKTCGEVLFDNGGEAEDWRFLQIILKHQPKLKITDKIYYMAPKRGNNTK